MPPAPPPAAAEVLQAFAPLFRPRAVAVFGASATAVSAGNRFVRHLKAFGFPGRIVPIHPSAREVEGLPAHASVHDAVAQGGPIDLAYVAVGAARVPEVLLGCAGLVPVAQVMTSGFAETPGGAALQGELLDAARKAGLRVVGPNCLGLHVPAARLTFTERVDPEPGPVGVVCQSGGLGIDIVRRGQSRGLRFSGLVTVGNCADVQPSELVEYFLHDPGTRVIGLYLEGATDARRLFEVLREAAAVKPVVILKGAMTQQGLRAAASHTGALAASESAWRALAAQTGCVLVDTLEAFLDVLVAFQSLAPRPHPTTRVVLFGNGGGTSVLGADAAARAGLEVPALQPGALEALEALALPPGSSVLNPIDVPAGALQQDEGRAARRILDAVQRDTSVDALVIHINMTVVLGFRHVDMLGNLVDAVLAMQESRSGGPHVVLVLRSDGDAEVEARKREDRARAMARGLAVFDELPAACAALAALRHLERFRARHA